MIKGTLELDSCSVAVTANSVVLTVRSNEGKTYTITMPRSMGETMAEELVLGMQNVLAATPQAAARTATGASTVDLTSGYSSGDARAAPDLRARSGEQSRAVADQVDSAHRNTVQNGASFG